MRLLRNLDHLESVQGCVLSIGNFDGVHHGHRVILRELSAQAKNNNCAAVVLTFDPHPLSLLRPEFDPPRLTTLEHKAALIGESGIDCVIAYPTDQSLLNLTAEEFFQQIVIDKLHAIGMVEGPNFFFGKDRSGDTNTLRQLCRANAIELNVVEPEVKGQQMISSSNVRKALQRGDVRHAHELLGRDYLITGKVVTGAQRGRTIGLPTANLGNVETLIPDDGVYAATCVIEGAHYGVALSIGPNPTFKDESKKIEAHLLGFTGDLYGQEITLSFIERIRGIKTFENVNALTKQVAIDIEKIRRFLEAEINLPAQ